MSHPVAHTATKYSNTNQAQIPTVIAKQGSVLEIIVPMDNILWTEQTEDALFPNDAWSFWPVPLTLRQRQYEGKTIQLVMPLEIENTINDYRFVFEVHASIGFGGADKPPLLF